MLWPGRPPGFFSRIGYDVGEVVFTPDDIRHGILRANQRQPCGLFQPFADSDLRCIHVIDPLDPRIHFALSGACRFSPRFAVYDLRDLREQLDRAASRFINSPQVESVPRKNQLVLSSLFKWFRGDFGLPGRPFRRVGEPSPAPVVRRGGQPAMPGDRKGWCAGRGRRGRGSCLSNVGHSPATGLPPGDKPG